MSALLLENRTCADFPARACAFNERAPIENEWPKLIAHTDGLYYSVYWMPADRTRTRTVQCEREQLNSPRTSRTRAASGHVKRTRISSVHPA
ncbi:MAG: hypothetical protein GY820_42460 [Gammaproteobacteria bacterium]|nr:hypothetical protein [Gammaproteobacteria bacterium]